MTTRPGFSNAARRRESPLPDEGAEHVNRNLLIAGALLVATMATVWVVRSHDDSAVERETQQALEANQDATWPAPTEAREGAVGSVVTAAASEPDSSQQFRAYVDDKYRAFYKDVEGSRLEALRAA